MKQFAEAYYTSLSIEPTVHSAKYSRHKKSSPSPEDCVIKYVMLVKGIEPPAYALRVRCSTPELHQQVDKFLQSQNHYTAMKSNCKPLLTIGNTFIQVFSLPNPTL